MKLNKIKLEKSMSYKILTFGFFAATLFHSQDLFAGKVGYVTVKKNYERKDGIKKCNNKINKYKKKIKKYEKDIEKEKRKKKDLKKLPKRKVSGGIGGPGEEDLFPR